MTVENPEPGGRQQAPGPAGVVQRFINTNDREGPEQLCDPAALRDWLISAGMLDTTTTVTRADHAHALGMREALRDLAAANAGLQHDPSADQVVNAAARRARLEPILTTRGQAVLRPATVGVDAALGLIVAAVHAAIGQRTWPRLKACQRDSCRWVFYDRSKNQTGRWCATSVCGAREKNKRAYRRRNPL